MFFIFLYSQFIRFDSVATARNGQRTSSAESLCRYAECRWETCRQNHREGVQRRCENSSQCNKKNDIIKVAQVLFSGSSHNRSEQTKVLRKSDTSGNKGMQIYLQITI